MDTVHELLAGRYARALLLFSNCPYDQALAWRLDAFVTFLNRYQIELTGVSLDIFLRIARIYEVEASCLESLVALLKMQKREELFISVVRNFAQQYKELYKLEFCSIASSHVLTEEQKEALGAFLERASGKRIFYTTAVDRGLIAGVRVEGDSLMWEHSISSQLRAIEQLQ